MTFAVRGIIEGFYDRLWTWEERERVAAFCADRGFDTYVYAPKEDRLQNAGWRTPYPDADERAIRAFGQRCRTAGMALWLGLRPVGIAYTDDADADLVAERLRRYLDIGADRLVLLADDIPAELDARAGGRFGSLAEAHLWLIDRLLGELGVAPDRLVFVPTDYAGAGSPYLAAVGEGVPDGVELCWTGRDVCSPEITAIEAEAIGRVMGRPPLVWDNYPVNDAGMTEQLHIGPIRGRDGRLGAQVAGLLVNPALQPEATLVPLATWGEYLRDPGSYDPDAAFQRGLETVCGDADDAAAVAVLAAAHDRSVIAQGWTRPAATERGAALDRLSRLRNRRLAEDLAPLVGGGGSD